jgi:hypothetical protein
LFHHQPEAQHPKYLAIHKLPADYPIYWTNNGQRAALALNGSVANDPSRPIAAKLWCNEAWRCAATVRLLVGWHRDNRRLHH